jgi:hypothetical protein
MRWACTGERGVYGVGVRAQARTRRRHAIYRILTVPLPWFATQIWVPSNATPFGFLPTVAVAATLWLATSTSVTAFPYWFVTQTRLPSKAMANGKGFARQHQRRYDLQRRSIVWRRFLRPVQSRKTDRGEDMERDGGALLVGGKTVRSAPSSTGGNNDEPCLRFSRTRLSDTLYRRAFTAPV